MSDETPAKKYTQLTDALFEYVIDNSLREHDLLKQLHEETELGHGARMVISPDQGQFMALLIKLINAKNIIEIGTFTGYSSLAMAMALGDDGKIITCDISEKDVSIAKKYWELAKVDEKIESVIGPAIDTLQSLIEDDRENSFDMAFIDADKRNYPNYYEMCLTLVRTGGLILIDNVLWHGDVAVPEKVKEDKRTKAIDDFNKFLHQDERVELSMLTISDGLTLALVR